MILRVIKDNDTVYILFKNGIKTPADKNLLSIVLKEFNTNKIERIAKELLERQQITNIPAKFWTTTEENYYETGIKISKNEMHLVKGEDIAFITDEKSLVIKDFKPFLCLFENLHGNFEDYVTVAEFAKMHNKSVEQVKVSCKTGRLTPVKKIGRDWVIPKDLPWPVDRRSKQLRNS